MALNAIVRASATLSIVGLTNVYEQQRRNGPGSRLCSHLPRLQIWNRSASHMGGVSRVRSRVAPAGAWRYGAWQIDWSSVAAYKFFPSRISPVVPEEIARVAVVRGSLPAVAYGVW